MNKLLKNLRHRGHSGVVTILLLGIATPACTSSHWVRSTAKNGTNAANPSIQHDDEREQDRSSNVTESGLVDTSAGDGCTNAIYWADEPLSSQIERTSAADLEQMCADEKSACMTRCLNNPNPPYPALKKGDRAHFALCHKRCFNQFMKCIRQAGLLQEFSVFDAALAWMKSHGKEIVGTIVIIGGVVYVVSTGGSGALVLAVL
jgi:hypothetical protein